MNGRRTAGSCLPAAGALHGPNRPLAGWLSQSHKQQLARGDFLGSISSFQQRRIQHCWRSQLMMWPFSSLRPGGTVENPGHAILTGTGRPHTLAHLCFSKAPRYTRSQENRASSQKGQTWDKNRSERAGPRKHHQQQQPSLQSPLQLVPTRFFPPSTEHRHIQPFQLAHIHPSLS